MSLARDEGQRKQSQWAYFKEYMWMVWDGLDFFGFDDTKLPRLRGVKPSIYDKFKNKKQVSVFAIMLAIAILIITRESSKIGSIKSQQIILTEQSHFKYNASEVLTMNGVNYFYTEQFLPRVREF